MLEARGSTESPILLSRGNDAAAVPSIREENSKLSTLSGFSSKRMVAMTDKSLNDCTKVIVKEKSDIIILQVVDLPLIRKPCKITAARASFVIVLMSSFPVQTLGKESLS